MLPLITFADNVYAPEALRACRESCARNGAELVQLTAFDERPGTPFAKFAEGYFHASTTSVRFNLLCFGRHIAIHDYASAHGLDSYIMMDPDVLLNSGAMEMLAKYLPAGQDVMLSRAEEDFPNFEDYIVYSPHFAYWTRQAHGEFIDYFVDLYSSEAGRDRIRQAIEMSGKVNGKFIVSDMMLLDLWVRERNPILFNSTTIKNGVTIDHNISVAEHDVPNAFRMRYGMKDFISRQGQIFLILRDGEPVYPIALHFQGRSKMVMGDFLTGHFATARAKTLVIDTARKLRIMKRRLVGV